MNKGLIINYTLNEDYFVIGSAYQLHISTNDFRIGVLVAYSQDYLLLKVFDSKGNEEEMKLSIDDILYNSYGIIKMQPDYVEGNLIE